MPFLRPLPMAKVGFVGMKDDREVILSVLHDLRVLQIEPIGAEALKHLTLERAPELQRTVGDQLVRVRGLLAALPPAEPGPLGRFPTLESVLSATRGISIDEEVGRLKREEEEITTELAALAETREVLDRFPFYTAPFGWLQAKSLLAFFGEAKPEVYETIHREIPALAKASQFVEDRGRDSVRFLVAVPTAEAETVGRLAQQRGVRLVPAPRLTGTAAEERPRLEAEAARLNRRAEEIRTRLGAIAREWVGTLRPLEEALSIENRKLEVYPKLGAGDRAFAVEGWIPVRDRPRLEATLESATRGRAIAYELPSTEGAPTVMENPPGVRWFEFFVRFYSIPQASEWDPTWTFAVVFPILFGFMLGDVGYAAVILTICLWMIAGFPGGGKLPRFIRGIPKMVMPPPAMRQLAYALVPGCVVGIVIGAATNSYFGFSLGYTALLNPLKSTGELLVVAGYIGLAMVVYGFLLGALKEYFHHRPWHAAAKVGGIVASLSLAGFGLGLLRGQLTQPNLPIWGAELVGLIVGILVMVVGEGIMGGLLGFIEVLSHILSFTRLIGILLASVILALVINNVAWGTGGGTGLVHAAPTGLGIVFILLGIALLIGGQMFNVILGVFEPGIQGMRLMFVEHFSKFYEGSGKPFQPFGARRTHTQSAHVPSP